MNGVTLLTISLAAFTFGVQMAIAFLNPPCSQIPFQPGCTHDPSLVTPTLRACPLPYEEWIIAARAASGNLPRPDGVVPPWFNRPLALRGQQVNSEYHFPWYAVMVFAILIKLNIPDIRNPLMFNKKNMNGPVNAKRDTATLMQGLVLAKDYFYDMPIEGNSSYIDSVRNVAAIHANVEMRANAKQASEGCIVSRHDYTNQTTNDVSYDAFESDMKNSKIPQSQRTPSPTTWPTGPPETECKSCKKYEPVNLCEGPQCTRLTTKCIDCSGCKATSCKHNAVPACKYAQVKTFQCGTCVCDGKNANCGQCETCTSTKKYFNFVPPLFNQQAMVLVLYPVVAYPILFPKDLAMDACDEDFWAFNHFFAAVGYGLGIDDKYNVFLQPDLESARIYYKKIHEQIIIPSLFTFDKQTRLMMDNFFNGLSTVSGGILSPTFLLHRLLHNLLNQPAPRLRALMRPRELALDRALDFAYKPQFMSNPTYRNLANRALNGLISRASAAMFQENCKDFKTTSQKCFV
ncbi:hypothetical protein Fcan01_25727 [Folsomia candida]|uniref:Uncharacterized protein n=1 Tax=Folsomia candida TaxID=158441 RepID=A0A226D3T0_FOLCA|nr:hypothetical protein Fcan01_25727 [Folsomia candida]